MKKLFLLGLIGLMGLMGSVAHGQMLDPAKRSYSVKEISATEAELIITVKLDQGWHMYSQYTSADGPLATVFDFAKSGDYQLVGKVVAPKPHEEMDPLCQATCSSSSPPFRYYPQSYPNAQSLAKQTRL